MKILIILILAIFPLIGNSENIDHDNEPVYKMDLDCDGKIDETSERIPDEPDSYMPPGGYVSKREVALKIALAVLEDIYGKEEMELEKPFHTELKDGKWYIYGYMPPNTLGGVAEIEIDQITGAILRVTHGE